MPRGMKFTLFHGSIVQGAPSVVEQCGSNFMPRVRAVQSLTFRMSPSDQDTVAAELSRQLN